MTNTRQREGLYQMLQTKRRPIGECCTKGLRVKRLAMLRNAFIFYSVGRYDVKGKQLLKTLGKNYITDMGFRNMLLGTHVLLAYTLSSISWIGVTGIWLSVPIG